jgi:hypothetical protein
MPWLIFFAFEIVTYATLRWGLLPFAVLDQWTPQNTITQNWAVAVWFVLGHLAATTAAYLALAQRLPQKHRAQVLPWFWRSLLAIVVEVFVLMG